MYKKRYRYVHICTHILTSTHIKRDIYTYTYSCDVCIYMYVHTFIRIQTSSTWWQNTYHHI